MGVTGCTFACMRKNQKYTQEEMYLAIDIWKESGLSMKKFCKQENLAEGTFKYWQLKYNKTHKQSKPASTPFIPIDVSSQINSSIATNGTITIAYPNGIEVICPMGIGLEQLKTLIKL
jgi:hypothetical protein